MLLRYYSKIKKTILRKAGQFSHNHKISRCRRGRRPRWEFALGFALLLNTPELRTTADETTSYCYAPKDCPTETPYCVGGFCMIRDEEAKGERRSGGQEDADPLLPAALGHCRTDGELLVDSGQAYDPWLQLLCAKSFASTFRNRSLWKKYTEVYRRLRWSIFPDGVPPSGLIISAKLYANGDFSSNRYVLARYRRQPRKNQFEYEGPKKKEGDAKATASALLFSEHLIVFRNVAIEMGAPSKIIETW